MGLVRRVRLGGGGRRGGEGRVEGLEGLGQLVEGIWNGGRL